MKLLSLVRITERKCAENHATFSKNKQQNSKVPWKVRTHPKSISNLEKLLWGKTNQKTGIRFAPEWQTESWKPNWIFKVLIAGVWRVSSDNYFRFHVDGYTDFNSEWIILRSRKLLVLTVLSTSDQTVKKLLSVCQMSN